MQFLATQAINPKPRLKAQMLSKKPNLESIFQAIKDIFLACNLKICSVKLMVKQVLLHQAVPLEEESITLQELNLPLWLPTPTLIMQMFLINLRQLLRSLEFNVEKTCTRR